MWMITFYLMTLQSHSIIIERWLQREREDCIEQSPEDAEGLVLYDGMIFETQEKAMEAYNQYACHKRFSIQKGLSYRFFKDKKIIKKEFIYYKEEINKPKSNISIDG